ncbi:hypothetical protein B0H13DRAFT_2001419 [Mycena leptocephala]|nr:hypothetical protein B0H13DRAFT_2001419 [Mycena leptocephala]
MDVDGELFTIASTLFDKYGEVRLWLLDNEYHKGSGVWGRELNEGRLIFVFCVSVDPPYRRQGVASWALQQLYASEYIDKKDKMLCWPSPIPRPPTDQWVTAFDGIVDFFRKAGYRRVGATSFFAYSQDPNHPSRKTDRLHDFDPDDTFSNKGPHPRLHYKTPSSMINMHAKDPSSIHLPDPNGFRPVFVAVKSKNLHALRTLVSLGLSDDDFNSRDNGDHITPLEACNDDMRCSREFSEILSDGWQGHSDISLRIKATLKRAMGHPMLGTDDDCDKCHGGWLSARTLMRLKVFKTFILGYGCIMKVIAQLLSCFILPTEPVIRAELQNGQIDYFEVQAANFYFRKGGRVEYALAAIVDGAEASFVDLQGAARLLSTPSCVNDREFGIVRKNLGLDPQQTWGPYSIMPQPTTWTTDSDDSEEGEDDEEEGDDDGDDGQDEDDEGRDDDDDQDQ